MGSDLRAAFRQPPYNGMFKQEIERLVGSHKTHQLTSSGEHDYLVIAALTGNGSLYPDLRHTSSAKAPVALSSLMGQASAVRPIRLGHNYPFRDGDFEDCITLELMRSPAVTNTGYIMELESVQQLIRNRRPCPFTRNRLTSFTAVDDNPDTEYTLFNGNERLGLTWMPILHELRKASGLRSFTRLKRVPMYRDFKQMLCRALRRDLSDEDFIDILERDFKAHVSSASPCRKMVLGSQLFGQGRQVMVEQFRARTAWPQDGQEDFFVVLPQPGVVLPYCIPIEKRDANALFHPPNYYRTE